MSHTEQHTFVLVHGAFHGAWCWKTVCDLLQDAGHRVYTPTLTGLGERAHLAGDKVDLETHITDIAHLIEDEKLTDIILVGHSYASYVVAGVADRYAGKVKQLWYLDSYLPDAGTSFFSNIPEEQLTHVTANLIDGYLVPPFPPEFFGVVPKGSREWKWVNDLLTPQPIATFQQELVIQGSIDDIPKTYIRCTPDMQLVDDAVYQTIKGLAGWHYCQLEGVHDAMVMTPETLSALFLDKAETVRGE